MNLIFPLILIVSATALCFFDPNGLLSALTAGAKSGVTLTLTLVTVYSVWLGIYEIAERAGIPEKLGRALKTPIKIIFGNTDDATLRYIALNLSANLLGLGGIATPMGIEAAALLKKQNDFYALTMLIVVASTSIQLLPTSVISLRIGAGSSSPSSIILPSVLSTFISSACGILLTKIFIKR